MRRVRDPVHPLGVRPPRGARRPVLGGIALVVVGLALLLLQSMFLMDYEDTFGDAGSPWSSREWRAGLGPGMRTAFWVSAIGYPVATAAGVVLLAIGVRRALRTRRR